MTTKPSYLYLLLCLPVCGTLHAEQVDADQMCITHHTPATIAEETKHTASVSTHDAHQRHKAMAPSQTYNRLLQQYSIPQLDLVTMQGKGVTLEKLLDTDQPIALNFIFTSCTTICPIMSATFSRSQHRMGKDASQLRWISVTIDPDYDTPERLRSYAQHFNAGPQWEFITGDSTSIIALQKAFDIYRGDKMNHVPVTLLRAGRDSQWLRLEGLLSSSDLVKEYQHLTSSH